MSSANAPGPLVSVITPTLNQGVYIEDTIRSIRSQDYPNLEHIIIDGGSGDGTQDILRRHESTYNMRWLSETDTGMYHAINKGLGLAQGEVLCYLNSDDLYFPWTVRTVAEALTSQPHSGFVFGDVLSVDHDSTEGLLRFHAPFRLGPYRRSGMIAQPALFWRRAVAETLGPFDESLAFVADCDFWMRLGSNYPGHKLNEVLAIERNHPQTKRSTSPQRLAEELLSVRNRFADPRRDERWVTASLDRIYFAIWRRLTVFRFIYSRMRSGGPRPWNEFLRHSRHLHVSIAKLFLTVVPGIAAHVERGAISVDTGRGPAAFLPFQHDSPGH